VRFDHWSKGYEGCKLLFLTVKEFRMEAMNTLELALWEARITDGTALSTMQDTREYPILVGEFDVDILRFPGSHSPRVRVSRDRGT
jgi:hypothetical protein